MSKALDMSRKLEKLDLNGGMKFIEKQQSKALHTEVFEDTMYIMHKDGSSNIIEMMTAGLGVHVLSAANTLKVLHTYKPFTDAFNSKLH